MNKIVCPVAAWNGRVNSTPHGRSVHRPVDVPGHNVFRGWTTWETNGHKGVGDGIDLFAPARSPVVAAHDGRITQWRNDATKLEVVYVEGDDLVSVYAHVNFAEHERKVGQRVQAGDVIATVRSDLADPHLHFELWVDGAAVSGSTPAALKEKLVALWSQRIGLQVVSEVGTVIRELESEVRGGRAWVPVTAMEKAGLVTVDRSRLAAGEVILHKA